MLGIGVRGKSPGEGLAVGHLGMVDSCGISPAGADRRWRRNRMRFRGPFPVEVRRWRL